MAFDPDKFLAETAQPADNSFDPDKFLSETAPEPKQPGGYIERVKAGSEKAHQKSITSMQRDPSLLNRVLATGVDVGKSVGGVVTEIPGIKKAAEYGKKYFEATNPIGMMTKTNLFLAKKAAGLIPKEVPQTIGSLAQSYQENAPEKLKNAVYLGAMVAGAVPVGRGVAGAVEGAVKGVVKIPGAVAAATRPNVEKAIKEGIESGVKPRFTSEKKTVESYDRYLKKAETAVKTIDENKANLNLVDDAGEKVVLPKNNEQFAHAIKQTKQQIYDQYHAAALQAGGQGAQFYVGPIVSKLSELSRNMKFPKEIREYAVKLKDDIMELNGQPPDVIEGRIEHYNRSLSGLYEGRVSKEKAQIDGSVAALMRKELDDMIEKETGTEYQELKNKYGALKAIEKDVEHRALQLAKKSKADVFDITDVFTGGELAGGLMTMNPALLAKSAAGYGIKELWKWRKNPDRFIGKMFKTVDKANEPPAPQRSTLGSLLQNERGAIGSENILKNAGPTEVSERVGNLKNMSERLKTEKTRSYYTMDKNGKPILVTEEKLPIAEVVRRYAMNERGAIGSGGSMGMDDFLPAIKDPETGKVYVGNWLYGHKFVSAKGESELVKNRLANEYLKDNISKGNTQSVGFVDKKGNFVSRQEAERLANIKKSPVQMYHDEGVSNLKILGATGLGSAAGLTGMTLGKTRKKAK